MQINIDSLIITSPIMCLALILCSKNSIRNNNACIWAWIFCILCSILLNCFGYNYYSIIDIDYRIYIPFVALNSLIVTIWTKATKQHENFLYIIMLYLCTNMLLACFSAYNKIYTIVLICLTNAILSIIISAYNTNKKTKSIIWVYFSLISILSSLTIIIAPFIQYRQYTAVAFASLLLVNTPIIPIYHLFIRLSTISTIYSILLIMHCLCHNIIIYNIIQYPIYITNINNTHDIIAKTLLYPTILYSVFQSILSNHIRKRFIHIAIFDHGIAILNIINCNTLNTNIISYAQCLHFAMLLSICANISQYASHKNKTIIDIIFYFVLAIQIFLSVSAIKSFSNPSYIIMYGILSSIAITSIILTHKNIYTHNVITQYIPMEKITSVLICILLNIILIYMSL